MSRLLICFLLALPAAAQDLTLLQSASVLSAKNSGSTVYLVVRVCNKSARCLTWDHYLSATEMMEWTSKDERIVINRAFLYAAKKLENPDVAPPIGTAISTNADSIAALSEYVTNVKGVIAMLEAQLAAAKPAERPAIELALGKERAKLP